MAHAAFFEQSTVCPPPRFSGLWRGANHMKVRKGSGRWHLDGMIARHEIHGREWPHLRRPETPLIAPQARPPRPFRAPWDEWEGGCSLPSLCRVQKAAVFI
eukprot:1599820-Prymnesium_polylepis.1